MKLCRYNDDRLGLVSNERVLDVTSVLEKLPAWRWPAPMGDGLIDHLSTLRVEIERVAKSALAIPIADVALKSPVANPTKIIGAPANYTAHVDEAAADLGISQGKPIASIGEAGLFLKANSALCGPSAGIHMRFPERRTDHEGELAAIIGSKGTNISLSEALEHVAAYSIGLDMTVRGAEDRSFRKSIDSYAVLGPWLTTADEIPDPNNLELELQVNGETRQKSNTCNLIYNVQRLVEYASSFYTLYPGDVIMTGTPEGVGPVKPGDLISVSVERLGRLEVRVSGAER